MGLVEPSAAGVHELGATDRPEACELRCGGKYANGG
jgi:hypothetical protein